MNEYIKSSEKTAMRLKKLSDDMFKYLLVFGDSAKPCELEEYDAATLTDQLLSEHVLLLTERGYDVRFTAHDAGGATVLTSAPELMRIIDNVFSNIRKYADRGSPVNIGVTVGEDRATMTFSNRVAADIAIAESTGIGLKTCAKIAELISCEFSYVKDEESFSATIGLISQRRQI
jgi:signal transduction histidine kinase